MKTNEERLQDLFSYLGNLSHVKADEIPDIDLYMDQVTTFMDSHLKDMRRHPGDKVLTKTMINNCLLYTSFAEHFRFAQIVFSNTNISFNDFSNTYLWMDSNTSSCYQAFKWCFPEGTCTDTP